MKAAEVERNRAAEEFEFYGDGSVYQPYTSLGRIRCFWRFSRLIESIPYAYSTSFVLGWRTTDTLALPAAAKVLQFQRQKRRTRPGQGVVAEAFACCGSESA